MKRLIVFAACLALAACTTGGEEADGGSGSTGGTSSGTTGGSSTSGGSGSTGGTSGTPDAGATMKGLSADVTVTYDGHDIPHIHCGTLLDCIRVQGYVHAHDRFFEMDLYRHIAEGRLSELVGSAGLQEDTFFRTIFVTRTGQRIEAALADALDANTRALIQAYADGVNDYLAQARSGQVPMSSEYQSLLILPAQIGDWTIQDSLAIGRLQQWELSETLTQEVGLAQLFQTLNENQLAALINPSQIAHVYTIPGFPLANPPPAPLRNPSSPRAHARTSPAVLQALRELGQNLAEVKRAFGPVGFTGSNDWVVDGAHSATGAAMVANDPHLTLQYPPLFHLAHLTADTDGVDLLGATFPGVPGALTGRGAHVGWGVTVVGYDVTDLYVETFSDTAHVSFQGGSVPVLVVPQTINIRDPLSGAFSTESLNVTIVPEHGPIIQQIDATHALSLRWTGQEVTYEFRALANLFKAQSVDDAFNALEDWGTGAQNFVLADDQGHIGYDPHALVPARPWAGQVANGAPLLPWLPLPGDGSAEWGYGDGGTWLPDSALPQSKDPAQGFLATANSDPVGVTDDDNVLNDQNYLSFDFDDTTAIRLKRITEMLQGFTADGGKVSLDDMQAIQGDHAIDLAGYVVPIAQDSYTPDLDPDGGVGAAVGLFDAWSSDGHQCPSGLTGLDQASAVDTDPQVARDSAACTYFHAFLRTVAHDVFADENAQYHVSIDPQLALKAYLAMSNDEVPQDLCDDLTTPDTVESCADITRRALGEARDILVAQFGPDPMSWRWGAVHGAVFENPLGQGALPGFEAGPFARPGGVESVDVASPSIDDVAPTDSAAIDFNYGEGPNERFIAVMDGTHTLMQLPGYEVDVPFTSATGLLHDWLTNTYFEFPRTQQQVDQAKVSQVVFHPAPSTP